MKTKLAEGLRLIELIVNAHPDRVRLLYRKYGIPENTPVNAQTLFSAIIAEGKPFIADLSKAASMKTIAGPSNDGATDPDTGGWFSNFDPEKFSTSLSTVFGAITSGAASFNEIWGMLSGTTQNRQDAMAQLQLELEMHRMNNEQQARTQQTIVYAVAGLALFAIIAFFVYKK